MQKTMNRDAATALRRAVRELLLLRIFFSRSARHSTKKTGVMTEE
jgi:hypothetical protein